MTIFIRHRQYLNERYQWANIPHLFPAWQAGDVLEMMMACKDRPTGVARVSGKSINLDALEVVTI